MGKLLLSFLIGLGLVLTCTATVYPVGDTAGWEISTDFDSWAKGKNFKVGDVLLFQYSSLHTVDVVTKDNYDNCNATGALQSNSGGNTSIPLTTAGNKYFICGTLSHCLGGMKLQVSVNAGAQETSPAGAPLPPKSPDPVPAPSTDINKTLPTTPSLGFSYSARDSLLFAWSCIFGTLLWTVII
ncbi:stellacyanin-like [Magnolia sinica]|uniref:stellacyanin-like n=1 Tax=Magnolia sinica TaxID=86752 RepID=UPI0026589249|nr:stellacyanin-like [Magnolia sinica]XP_058086158.1 stellacyanin-like [Magnolia sinica]